MYAASRLFWALQENPGPVQLSTFSGARHVLHADVAPSCKALVRCACRGACTRNCSCKKNGALCGRHCGCTTGKGGNCKNH